MTGTTPSKTETARPDFNSLTAEEKALRIAEADAAYFAGPRR